MFKHQGLLLCALIAAIGLTVVGCGNDESSNPVLSLSLDPDSTGVEICSTIDITADVAHGEASEVDWYVDGILGGNSTQGTISQTNPAVYSAPEVIPAEATVVVRAVSREDTSKAATCRVTVVFTVIHVDATTGSDESGTGCVNHAFKTITHAFEIAQDNMTVQVAPGIYDATNGEVFPLNLPGGVALVGEDWETTIIRGHSGTASYHEAIDIYGPHSTLKKFTLEQGEPAAETCQLVVSASHTATGLVLDSLRVSERAAYSVIRLDGPDSVTVSHCFFVVTGGQPSGRGFEIVSDVFDSLVRDCTISGFFTGLFFNYSSDPKVENCTLEGNQVGAGLCCLGDTLSNPNPDFGGGARGSTGGNIIRNNASYGLRNDTVNTVFAKYNTWAHNPPTVNQGTGSDIYNSGTGGVVWE